MNYLDLFSGIGGFALGAYWAGWRFDNHYFSEVDDYAIRVYRQRFPEAINLGDITLIADSERLGWTQRAGKRIQSEKQIPERQNIGNLCEKGTWIITGGFPCQDISCAGKGEGIEGRRSGLWFAMRDIIRLLRPRYAIIENVGAITNRGLDVVLANLAEIGYDAEWQDIRASDVGAPHRRERIWIVAYPKGGRCERGGQDEMVRVGELASGIERGSQDVADTAQELRYRTRKTRPAGRGQHSNGNWWSVEPDVGRVAHGIPKRVDRLKCLGNSIVPQIAETLFRLLKEAQ